MYNLGTKKLVLRIVQKKVPKMAKILNEFLYFNNDMDNI